MAMHGLLNLLGLAGQTADVVARLNSGLFRQTALQRHPRHRAQRLPLAPLAQVTEVAWVRNRPAGAASMIRPVPSAIFASPEDSGPVYAGAGSRSGALKRTS